MHRQKRFARLRKALETVSRRICPDNIEPGHHASSRARVLRALADEIDGLAGLRP